MNLNVAQQRFMLILSCIASSKLKHATDDMINIAKQSYLLMTEVIECSRFIKYIMINHLCINFLLSLYTDKRFNLKKELIFI